MAALDRQVNRDTAEMWMAPGRHRDEVTLCARNVGNRRVPRHLPFTDHPRLADNATFVRAANELDDRDAIGSLYRYDRFAAPASVWTEIQLAFPKLAGPAAT
jgi:hypothetical protein